MSTGSFSTAHLDYLRRNGIDLTALSASMPSTNAPPNMRRLWRIRGVGYVEKQSIAGRLPSEDVLVGLHGYKIPLAFLVSGELGGIKVSVGTWAPIALENTSSEMLDSRQEILKAALNSLYPSIEIAPDGVELSQVSGSLSGLVLGIPMLKPPDPFAGADTVRTQPLDRVIRALSGANWTCLVLALPVDESVIDGLRDRVINEMRVVRTAAQAEKASSPLAEVYEGYLNVALQSLVSGLEVGAWRTAVYLLGDSESYYRLASVWRGVFSSEDSKVEPVRVWDSSQAAILAVKWAMPDTQGQRGPGFYQHLLQYQTLLTSTQLAAYVQLPQLETGGFSVNEVPDFDAVPPATEDDRLVRLGQVIYRGHPTQTNYAVGLKSLTRHAFVPGVTGAGKTNTIFQILTQAAMLKVPFLVLEPAKTEYRSLLNHPAIGNDLQIFTMGNENVSPFRLNPFEVPLGTPVSVHLDLLRSVFSVSFGMWNPLPQVLEECLHRIYDDRGWDITSNTNVRLADSTDTSAAFPTLTDLVNKVDEVTEQLGYEDKVTDDIRAALHTRINSLRTGGKGRMLDVQRSMPAKLWLEHPVVLELESMGDDDDKAFLMGLLLIRLVEHRRYQGPAKDLRHLLVVEEAHRLLANVPTSQQAEESNPRGKAVETFANMLSEIRAYGQGVIIADQVPVRLAPDVIKNTNLKIAHRTLAIDDRTALAGTMTMTEGQTKALTTMKVGEAAVFAEGDDAPLMIKVDALKDDLGKNGPDHKRVSDHMKASQPLKEFETLYLPHPACADMPRATATAAWEQAGKIVETPNFRRDFVRVVLSIIGDDGALDRLWPDLLLHVNAIHQRGTDDQAVTRCLIICASEWYAGRRGAQSSWSYAETGEFASRLRQVLLTNFEGKDPATGLASFRDCAYRLHARSIEPYKGCSLICTQEPPLCLYRYAVADLVMPSRDKQIADWNTANADGRAAKTWEIARDQALQLVESNTTQKVALKRIGLCYAQHMLAHHFREIHAGALGALLREADSSADGGKKDG